MRAQRDRAAGQGGTILMEPTDFPFGEQQYTVLDPWRHQRTFWQTIADVAPEEWGAETIDGRYSRIRNAETSAVNLGRSKGA